MAIPDYQSLMLPLLLLASDHEEHSIAETIGTLANEFKLTEQEQDELLPSGLETVLKNRARWARTFLKKAGLIDSTSRGKFRISQRGIEVLKDRPPRIDNKYLSRFSEFQDFRPSPQVVVATAEPTKNAEVRTPQETLDGSYQELRQALAQDVLGACPSILQLRGSNGTEPVHNVLCQRATEPTCRSKSCCCRRACANGFLKIIWSTS